MFPLPGATDACFDTALRLAFDTAPFVGRAGKLRVFASERPREPVVELDMGATEFSDRIGGREFRLPPPILVEGAEAFVRLRRGALAPERSYFVTIDDGVFVDSSGRSLGQLDAASAWRFTTRAPTVALPGELVVALDGTGDFCSVQGALDHVPAGNTSPVTVSIKRGIYREIVFVSGKDSLTLRGEDRAETRIAYANNENLQGKRGAKLRSLVGFENVSDLVIENLTLHNTTPQDGSQAEALRVEAGDRVILRNASFISRQDTLLLTGRVFVVDSFVEGNVDYVWGKGTAYFERSELRTVGRAGWNVQARNPPDRYGYVFVDSRFSADPAVSGHLLARIDAQRFPGSHVAYIGCRIGPHVDPKGWEVTPAGSKAVRFWEHGSQDLDGKPLDVRARHAASKQLTTAEAGKLRDRRQVFGGWDPLPRL